MTVIEYSPIAKHYIKCGEQACVFAYNHPTLGTGKVWTSVVTSYNPDNAQFTTTSGNVYAPKGTAKILSLMGEFPDAH